MLQIEPGVHFSLFHSKVLGSADFPLSGIPMQDLVDKIEGSSGRRGRRGCLGLRRS